MINVHSEQNSRYISFHLQLGNGLMVSIKHLVPSGYNPIGFMGF